VHDDCCALCFNDSYSLHLDGARDGHPLHHDDDGKYDVGHAHGDYVHYHDDREVHFENDASYDHLRHLHRDKSCSYACYTRYEPVLQEIDDHASLSLYF
jgi:hypothetical protein